MVYLGRIVGVGRTETGRPFVVYGVSGRSDSSRQRKAVPYDRRIAIGPLDQMTEEQHQQASLLMYDAITTSNELAVAVVSNGKHTNDIYDSLYKHAPLRRLVYSPLERLLHTPLEEWGAEPDRYHTPRIAGIIDLDGYAALGIVTKAKRPGVVSFVNVPSGKALVLSTYTGESTEPEAPNYRRTFDIIRKINLVGDTAPELAVSFFEWMDPEFVVCTASAVWFDEDYAWELAVKNLYA